MSLIPCARPAGSPDGQLMRRFDTSRPTVARAMRDLEQAGLIERRPRSDSYVRLPAAAKTSLLGLLIPGLGETETFEPIYGELARCCYVKAEWRHVLSFRGCTDVTVLGLSKSRQSLWRTCV